MPKSRKLPPEFRRGSGVKDPVDLRLGMKLRKLRISRGHTQSALALKIGVTFQQLQKYETGANRVSVSALIRICVALDVSPANLIAELVAKEQGEADLEPAPLKSYRASHALAAIRSDTLRIAMSQLAIAISEAEM
jgi:transcriptional regulator with XRE-family HTH domain